MKKEIQWNRTAVIVEVCCIVLVGLFDLSLCWMEGMLAYHKILVVLVNVVGGIVFPWLLLHVAWTRNALEKALADLGQGWQNIRKDHRKIIKYAAVMLDCGLDWESLSGLQRWGQFSHGGNIISLPEL